jgi:hypothetical protein
VHLDVPVNDYRWFRGFNDYDNWQASGMSGEGARSFYYPPKPQKCADCHMPLVASNDPASGDALDYNRTPGDRRHRSHRFIGANQVMPVMLDIPGHETQVVLTEKWLRGEFEIPEIADKWARGPAVALEILAPPEAAPGGDIALKAVVTSNKVGHDFPTGPLDIIQSWVEVVVTDARGRVVYESGTVNERRFIKPGSFMFKAEPVDQYGNLIDRHNLWEMVGVRYRRSLFPGFSDTADYLFRCPGGAGEVSQPPRDEKPHRFAAPEGSSGPLKVTARLLYRKIDQYLLNFMFGEGKGLTAPITEMARAEAIIEVRAPGRRAAIGAGGPPPDPPAVRGSDPGGSAR